MIKLRGLVRKKAGVSAVIGVILMVAITVAIAATVYWYVSGLFIESDTDNELTVEGLVYSIEESGTITYFNDTIYNVTLGEAGNSYLMLFRSEDAVVPPTGVTLKFFYEKVYDNDVLLFDVYMIKSL